MAEDQWYGTVTVTGSIHCSPFFIKRASLNFNAGSQQTLLTDKKRGRDNPASERRGEVCA